MRSLGFIQTALVALGFQLYFSTCVFSGGIGSNDRKPKSASINRSAREVVLKNPAHAAMLARKALALSLQENQFGEYMIACHTLADVKRLARDTDSSLYYCRKGLAVMDQASDPKITATLFGLLGLCFEILGDYDSARSYYRQALTIGSKENDVNGMAVSNDNLGVVYRYLGEYDTAFSYHSKALDLFVSLKEKRGIALVYNNLGNLYYVKAEYNKAIYYFLKSLKIKEEGKDLKGSASTLNNIASVYYINGNYPKALEYYRKGLSVLARLGDTTGQSVARGNMGLVFYDQSQYDSALYYFNKALKGYGYAGNQPGIAAILGNIGLVYYDQKEYPQALEYFQKALDAKRRIGDRQEIAISLNHLGSTYLKLKNFDMALKHADEAFAISRELHIRKEQYEAFDLLSSIYAGMGNFRKAYECLYQYSILKDSVFNEEKHAQITEMREKYETGKKEQQISLLSRDKAVKDLQISRQQNILFMAGLAFILVASVSALLFGRYLLKQKQSRLELERKNLEIEHRLLRSQMNPHFIFNSLNSIQSFITGKEIPEAEVYLAKFARLMRYILENSRKSFVFLEDEINTLTLYLELEKLRFENKFDFNIAVDPALDQETTEIPPLIVQPFVENSILHGIRMKKGKGLIGIDFRMNTHVLLCEVTDDGIGREKARQMIQRSGEHQSMGIQLIRERLDIFNKELQTDCSFSIEDTIDVNGAVCGTKVLISLPVRNA